MKSILFICSANKDRSKTAEDHFSTCYPDLSFNSAGTNKNICNRLGTNYITKEQLDTADIIFAMEQKHVDIINKIFSNNYFNKIKVLHIKDVYKYGSKELIDILESKIPSLREI